MTRENLIPQQDLLFGSLCLRKTSFPENIQLWELYYQRRVESSTFEGGVGMRSSRSLQFERHHSTHTDQAKALEPSMLIRTGKLVNRVSHVSCFHSDLHNGANLREIDIRAREIAQMPLADMLHQISYEYGFSWELTASLIGVTSAAIRKWRRENNTSEEKRFDLAILSAFTELIGRVNPRIDNVALWLESLITPDTSLRFSDLYVRGYKDELLDIASGRVEAIYILDKTVTNWRERFPRDPSFKVVKAPDGKLSIVPS